MPTLNELLSTTADTDDIVFDNFQFIVDENLRTISVPALGVVFGVEGDKDVNYINFSMVRFYDGTDLSEMELHVNYINAAGDMNYYRVPNIVVQNDTIMFSWLLSHDVTKYRGTTSFTLHFFKQVNGVISKSYNTTPAHGTVLEGINAETYVPEEEQYDILTHLQAELNNYTTIKKTELAMSGQTQLNAIQQKGTATLESIPEDYTTLNNKIKNMEDHFIVTDPAEVNEVTQIEMDPSAPDQEVFTADEINRIEMTIDRDDNDEFENTFHLMYEKAHNSDEPPQIVIDDHIPNKQFVLDRADELKEEIEQVSESITGIENVTVTKHSEPSYDELSGEISSGYPYATDVGKTVSIVSGSGRTTLKVSVNGISRVKIKASYFSTASTCGYIFADASNKAIVIFFDPSKTSWVNEEYFTVDVPTNAVWLYVNARSTSTVTRTPQAWEEKNSGVSYEFKAYTKEEADGIFEPKIIPQKKTYIILRFDETKSIYSDGRYDLVKSYGYPACFAVGVTDSGAFNGETLPHINEMLENGWDLGSYGRNRPSSTDFDNESLDWDGYVQTCKNASDAVGLFNITTWFCQNGRTGTALDKACRRNGYKVVSGYHYGTAESVEHYIKDWKYSDVHATFNGLYPSTKNNVLGYIDTAVENGWDIGILTHSFYDNEEDAESGLGCTVPIYTEVLEKIKSYVDNGQAEVVTYNEWLRRKYFDIAYNNDYERILKTIHFNSAN